MEKVLLFLIAAAGLWAGSSGVDRWYHFVHEPKTMREAQSYCREKYTDLVTISSNEVVQLLNEMADMSEMVNSENGPLAWIGLYDDLDSWKWSLSDPSFYKQGENEYRNWLPGEPNNWFIELCGLIHKKPQMKDADCLREFQSVCMDVEGHNASFVLNPIALSWFDAQSYCRESHTDLASVRNLEEQDKIISLIGTNPVWIGLSRDNWKWSDGSSFSFVYWEEGGEPQKTQHPEACVAANFSNSGRWVDLNCEVKAAFICYGGPPVSKQVIKLRLEKQTSLDLNDPAVLENILKQLEQRLKDQGVAEHVKLSWRTQSDGKVFHKEKEEEEEEERELFCQNP